MRKQRVSTADDGVPTRGRSRRAVKEAAPTKPAAAEKRAGWQQKECHGLHTWTPTRWQREFLDVIDENKITFCDSVAGTGKTSTALYHACRAYLNDPSHQIVFVRTPAEMGGDHIGFLPGEADMSAKLGPHFESTKLLLEDFIGKQKFAADLGKRIHFTIPNFALGHTRTNCSYVIDESQLLQPLILKLLLERIGEGTKTIVLGSSGQIYADTKGRNGLRDALSRFFTRNMTPKYDDIGFYKFPIEAVQRDSIVMSVISAYEGDKDSETNLQ